MRRLLALAILMTTSKRSRATEDSGKSDACEHCRTYFIRSGYVSILDDHHHHHVFSHVPTKQGEGTAS